MNADTVITAELRLTIACVRMPAANPRICRSKPRISPPAAASPKRMKISVSDKEAAGDDGSMTTSRLPASVPDLATAPHAGCWPGRHEAHPGRREEARLVLYLSRREGEGGVAGRAPACAPPHGHRGSLRRTAGAR